MLRPIWDAFSRKICSRSIFQKKAPKSGHVHGHRNRRTTGTMWHNPQNERASSERAIKKGVQGAEPPALFPPAFSRESLDPPPGTGREPTSQVLTCADLEGTTYRAPKSKRRAPLALSFPIVGVKPYCATSSQNRMRMVAIWAREALPAGFRVPSSMPWMMFSATAQAIAGWA